jgi:hypothetical protein
MHVVNTFESILAELKIFQSTGQIIAPEVLISAAILTVAVETNTLMEISNVINRVSRMCDLKSDELSELKNTVKQIIKRTNKIEKVMNDQHNDKKEKLGSNKEMGKRRSCTKKVKRS